MINRNGNGVRGLNEWNTKIQNLYLRLYNIKSPVFVNVKSMSSQSLLILWGDFVVSHPEVMIGYVQSIVRLRLFVLSHFLAW